jgi:multidrug efflux pump subunit AcrA (membrane-fusion protein)
LIVALLVILAVVGFRVIRNDYLARQADKAYSEDVAAAGEEQTAPPAVEEDPDETAEADVEALREELAAAKALAGEEAERLRKAHAEALKAKADAEAQLAVVTKDTEAKAEAAAKAAVDALHKELAEAEAKAKEEEAANAVETTSGRLVLHVVDYSPDRHRLAKRNEHVNKKFDDGVSDPKDVLPKPVQAKAKMDGEEKMIWVRPVLCADGKSYYRGGDNPQPNLKDDSLTAVELQLEETVLNTKKEKINVFMPFWVVPVEPPTR